MAEAVAEMVAVSRLSDHLARHGVDLLAGGPGRIASEGGELGRAAPGRRPRGPPPRDRRSRRCGCSPSSSRRAGRPCRRRPARRLPISRSPGSACGRAPFSPAATIGGNEGSAPSSRIRASAGASDVALGAPGEAPLQRPFVNIVGELRRGCDPLDLLGLFDDAELLDQVSGGEELDVLAGGRLEPCELADTELGVLEADPARHARDDLRDQLPLGLGALPLRRDLLLRALRVAEVGEEDELRAAHQAGAVRPGEAGQIAHVGQVRDEELVEFVLRDQLGEPSSPRHTPSLSAINSSASLYPSGPLP